LIGWAPGTDVLIFKIFSQNNGVFVFFCKIKMKTLAFKKNAIFSPKIGENGRKV
jgi:hypothetical protein